jgi:hypothetical protein
MSSFFIWNCNGIGLRTQRNKLIINSSKKEFIIQNSKNVDFLILTETKHNVNAQISKMQIGGFQYIISTSVREFPQGNERLTPLRGGGRVLSFFQN